MADAQFVILPNNGIGYKACVYYFEPVRKIGNKYE